MPSGSSAVSSTTSRSERPGSERMDAGPRPRPARQRAADDEDAPRRERRADERSPTVRGSSQHRRHRAPPSLHPMLCIPLGRPPRAAASLASLPTICPGPPALDHPRHPGRSPSKRLPPSQPTTDARPPALDHSPTTRTRHDQRNPAAPPQLPATNYAGTSTSRLRRPP